MASPRQAPAPYDGMGTPTRWDASTHDDGNQAERLDAAARIVRSRHAPARRERRVSCADRSTATTNDHHPNGSTLECGCVDSSNPRRPG